MFKEDYNYTIQKSNMCKKINAKIKDIKILNDREKIQNYKCDTYLSQEPIHRESALFHRIL